MARLEDRLQANVDGDFYVDAGCIDCKACTWIAPQSFERYNALSRVYRQPRNEEDRLKAQKALIACPVAAIGTRTKHDLKAARSAFPERVDENVYYCGYHAAASYGSASWFIKRRHGNILIDSPRFAGPLVKNIEAMGGIRYMFLSHRDDIADHQKFREHFGCERIIHEDETGAGLGEIERVIEGQEPVALDGEALMIPVPGHTRGSTCLLYRNRFLFTGDHMGFSPEKGHVHAFKSVCWYSWQHLYESMQRLADYRFEWILPGHGYPCYYPAQEMREQMRLCLADMKRAA